MGAAWLVKTEPETFGWEDLAREKVSVWDGVRNPEARKHMRSMARGDAVLVYHSGKERAVVGFGKVARTAYPDPTAEEGDWSAVDIRAVKPFKVPVTLAAIKALPEFSEFLLVRRARLSVMPVGPDHLRRIFALGKTKP